MNASRVSIHPDSIIAIIGLGYVGLPLAVEFGKIRPTIGFDINTERIDDLRNGIDITLEISTEELSSARHLAFSCEPDDLRKADIFIVTVPTPIDSDRRPDLRPLLEASTTIGKVIRKGAIVIYESTVYPGATEDDCIPVIEKVSGLKFNVDFYAGYSPERINPGDKLRPLKKIRKVTSGSTPEVAKIVDDMYRSIIEAGTHLAPNIRVAEAAKIIENTQRDVNIALINELTMVFDRMNINIHDVLDAASTKWNFVRLNPGLVGGHCIGVDPYYLVHKSITVGHVPDIIRTAREINDGMAKYFASEIIRQMIKGDLAIKNSKILVLGATFKEDCPDLRNSKVFDLVNELGSFGAKIDLHDPWLTPEEGAKLTLSFVHHRPKLQEYQTVVLAVAHSQFREFQDEIEAFRKSGGVLYDLKNFFH